MKKCLTIFISIFLFSIISSIVFADVPNYLTVYNPFTFKLQYVGDTNQTGKNITADFFFGDISLASGGGINPAAWKLFNSTSFLGNRNSSIPDVINNITFYNAFLKAADFNIGNISNYTEYMRHSDFSISNNISNYTEYMRSVDFSISTNISNYTEYMRSVDFSISNNISNYTEYMRSIDFSISNNISNYTEYQRRISAWKFINFTESYDPRLATNITFDLFKVFSKFNIINWTELYDAQRLTRWTRTNDTAALVDHNNSIADIYVNQTGDTMTGNLNMTMNNLTDVGFLKLSTTAILYHNVSENLIGLEHATAIHDTEDHVAGTISHVLIEGDSKILRTWQTGLPNAAGFMRNSQIISAQFGIIDATTLSSCSEMAEQMGIDMDGVGCNTTSLGASLLVKGSVRLGHKLAIGGGNKTSYGIIHQGFADFNMEGSNFNIFNGSLHPQTPRIEEVGFATGEMVTMIDEGFEDDSISPFQKREQVGVDSDNWDIDEDPDFCFDGICARAKGGDSRASRLMEVYIPKLQE